MNVYRFLGHVQSPTQVPIIVSPIDKPLSRNVHTNRSKRIEPIASCPDRLGSHPFHRYNELLHLPHVLGNQLQAALRAVDVEGVLRSIATVSLAERRAVLVQLLLLFLGQRLARTGSSSNLVEVLVLGRSVITLAFLGIVPDGRLDRTLSGQLLQPLTESSFRSLDVEVRVDQEDVVVVGLCA